MDNGQPEGEALWPNRYPVMAGIEEVSQDPELFADDPEDDPADELKDDVDGDR